MTETTTPAETESEPLVILSEEDTRELMRLKDHARSAPYSERYQQELAAFKAARGIK